LEGVCFWLQALLLLIGSPNPSRPPLVRGGEKQRAFQQFDLIGASLANPSNLKSRTAKTVRLFDHIGYQLQKHFFGRKAFHARTAPDLTHFYSRFVRIIKPKVFQNFPDNLNSCI
jgi:hypothetical protein